VHLVTYSKGCRETSFHPSVPSYIRPSVRSSFHLVMVYLFWRGGKIVESRHGTMGKVKDVVTTLLWESEDETHTLEIRTSETSKFDYRGQNTLHWGVFYIIGKLSKCRCWKWPRMGNLDIHSTCYGKKKGRESNCQFDSRPLKVGNWLDPGACK